MDNKNTNGNVDSVRPGLLALYEGGLRSSVVGSRQKLTRHWEPGLADIHCLRDRVIRKNRNILI